MYCPVCGSESTQGLNYCKRCGTNLTATTNPIRATEAISSAKLTGAAWAVALATVAVALGGLGIVFNSAVGLLRPSPFGPQPISGTSTIVALMVAFGSATVFGTVALLILLFSRFLGAAQESRGPARLAKQPPVAGEYKPAEIAPPPSVVGSVTEQTTRNFDPALYRDRES